MVRSSICFYSLVMLCDVYQTPMLVLLGWLWWPMLIYVLILELVLRLIKGFDVEGCCLCHAYTNSKPWCFVGSMCHLSSYIQLIRCWISSHDLDWLRLVRLKIFSPSRPLCMIDSMLLHVFGYEICGLASVVRFTEKFSLSSQNKCSTKQCC